MIRRTFSAPSRPGDSRLLAKDVVDFLHAFLADADALHDLDIILTEACANVVRHAYGREVGKLEVRVAVAPGRYVELDVADWGRGFDGEVRFVNPGPDSEGGRGLYIIRKLSDICLVSREGGQTVVHVRKNIGPSSWKT